MMWKVCATLFLASASLYAWGTDAAINPRVDFSAADWKEVADRDGIHVSLWDRGDLPAAGRAEGKIEAPLDKVLSTLSSVDRRSEWHPFMEASKVLDARSFVNRLEHWEMGTPFMLDDRDFIVEVRGSYDPAARRVRIDFWPGDEAAVPRKNGVVRGRAEGSFIFWPIDDGKHTQLVYQVAVDLAGSAPGWMMKGLAKDFPKKVIEGFRSQSKRKDLEEVIGLQDVAEGKPMDIGKLRLGNRPTASK